MVSIAEMPYTQQVQARVKTRPKIKQFKETYKPVDFSYLQDAVESTYDLECMIELFTNAMISPHNFSIVLFGDEQFADVTREQIESQIDKFIKKPDTIRMLKKIGIKDPGSLGRNAYVYKMGDANDMKEFESMLRTQLLCETLPHDLPYANKYNFAEYRTWNGASYDLPVLVLTYLWVKLHKEKTRPSDIRKLSNYVIRFQDKPHKFPEYIERCTKGVIKATAYRYFRNLALYKDGHIDWAKLAKKDTVDEASENLTTPGLKKEMAKDGMDVIIDELVASDEPHVWTEKEKAHLVEYNFNDVLATLVKSHNKFLKSRLFIRDTIRAMYPYTAARSMDMMKLTRYTPRERDATAAQIAGWVLIGPNNVKPVDYDFVDFAFPVPNPEKPGEMVWVDLWEYMCAKEVYVPNNLKQFFSHFRGKDTRQMKDLKKVLRSQPITHSSLMNVPYMRDGKATNSFARVSTGGAHGGVMAGLNAMSDEAIQKWIVSDADVKGRQKPTVDVTNVIHLDWSSFYPMLMSKMQMFLTTEGFDRFTSIVEYRIDIKNSLPFDKSTWTVVDVDNSNKQVGFKFLLNNSSGAANTHNQYATLPLDNKALSMRLMGNMFIWALAQRLTQAGAFIPSTNTDGIYICNISMEDCERVVREYVRDYGMEVEPETLSRFINRDASNRVEFINGKRQIVGGDLRPSHQLAYPDDAIGQNITYPLVAGNAALEYMSNNENWLTEPYNRDIVLDHIKSVRDKGDMLPFYHVFSGTKARALTIDGKRVQKVNRVVLTRNGNTLGTQSLSELKAEHMFEFIMQLDAGIQPKDMIFDGVTARFETDLFDDNKTYTMRDFGFVHKRKEFKTSEYTHVGALKACKDSKDLSDYMKIIKANQICLVGDSIDELTPIKLWKDSAKVTHYPSTTGITLNTAQELRDFDMNELDIDAYVRWTEQLLKQWKVTANLEEVGLVECDDTVIPKEVKIRSTKKSRAIEDIYELYGIGV